MAALCYDRAMLRRQRALASATILGAVCALFVASGCGDDAPGCIYDSDCPNPFDRCDQSRCVPIGSVDSGSPARDAGAMSDGGPRDAPSLDAFALDAPPLDSSAPLDAPGTDGDPANDALVEVPDGEASDALLTDTGVDAL